MTKATKAKTVTNAPVLAMTNEMAVKLARGFKTGIKNKTQVTAILTAALDAWINRKEIAARDFILAFWEALNGDKLAIAGTRALINRICKRINKENGKPNAPALTVKDGELVDVVPRGGNGGGDGDGDGEGVTVEKVAPLNLELQGALQTLNYMLKNSTDAIQSTALKYAIAKLAAQL